MNTTTIYPSDRETSLWKQTVCIETLSWINPTPTTMPDAFELVLVEREECDGAPAPVASGYWDGDLWRRDNDAFMTGKVTGWAPWPNGRQGGARHG